MTLRMTGLEGQQETVTLRGQGRNPPIPDRSPQEGRGLIKFREGLGGLVTPPQVVWGLS